MSKKKTVNEYKILTLPYDSAILELYAKKNKVKLTEHTISSIEHAVKNDLPFVILFKFSDSDFVVTISEDDYLTNVDNIYKFYIESENYELCPRVVKLQHEIKNKCLNEKET